MRRVSGTPRIADIAEEAGVSMMTVSRALRGVDGVSEAKRAEILKIAVAMKYVPNSNARSLALANSNLIGISLPTFAGEVFADILSGMRRTFDSAGYSSVIDTTEYDPAAELIWVKRLLSWQPAGIILTGTDHHAETIDLLRATDIPVLEIWDHTDDPIDICVGIDHFEAGKLVGAHAAALGYKRPAFVSTSRGHDTRADARLAGVRQVFAAKSIDVVSSRSDASNTFAAGHDGTETLLRTHDRDVIFYLNDHMAFGGLICCQERGMQSPEDIGIIGFNQLGLASVLPIKLTTVRTARNLMGIMGARNILARINNVDTQSAVMLPVELVAGQTTCRQAEVLEE